MRLRFPVERKLLEGTHESDSAHRSIIHFALNRSASQFTKRILCDIAKQNGLTPVHLNEYAFANDIPFWDRLTAREMDVCKHVFKPTGYIYSAFGGFVHGIPDLEKYLTVLMVRDPRDALTSRYYSKAFSHRLPSDRAKADEFAANRERIRRMSVDEYVLSESGEFCGRYRTYMKELSGRGNVHITKYEDMIGDFPNWLDGLLSFCVLSCGESTRAKLIAEASKSLNTKENKMKHRRQVIPGDHRRKLKPDTIARLNADLADILSGYGYV